MFFSQMFTNGMLFPKKNGLKKTVILIKKIVLQKSAKSYTSGKQQDNIIGSV